jgi:hypothetical protein
VGSTGSGGRCRLVPEPVAQVRDQAGLADARLAAEHGDLAFALPGAFPPGEQEGELVAAADERGLMRAAEGLEAVLDPTLAEDAEGLHLAPESLERPDRERLQREEAAE